jgi:hypothetical protein
MYAPRKEQLDEYAKRIKEAFERQMKLAEEAKKAAKKTPG